MILAEEHRSTRKKNLLQCLSTHHKSHLDSAGIEPGYPRLKARD